MKKYSISVTNDSVLDKTEFFVVPCKVYQTLKFLLPCKVNETINKDPNGYPARGLWDSGAKCCAVTPSFVKRYNLTRIGDAPLSGATGEKSLTGVYLLDLLLPLEEGEYAVIPALRVVEVMESDDYDFIIGKNIQDLLSKYEVENTRSEEGVITSTLTYYVFSFLS